MYCCNQHQSTSTCDIHSVAHQMTNRIVVHGVHREGGAFGNSSLSRFRVHVVQSLALVMTRNKVLVAGQHQAGTNLFRGHDPLVFLLTIQPGVGLEGHHTVIHKLRPIVGGVSLGKVEDLWTKDPAINVNTQHKTKHESSSASLLFPKVRRYPRMVSLSAVERSGHPFALSQKKSTACRTKHRYKHSRDTTTIDTHGCTCSCGPSSWANRRKSEAGKPGIFQFSISL